MKIIRLAAAVAFAATASFAAHAADISGAGASAPAPVYSKWAEAYKAATGTSINYTSNGSGAGIKQIQAKTVAFGATDKALTPAELDKADLVQFPTVIISIVPVITLPSIEANQVVLDGETLANIFLGKITRWNDPAIAKLNPSVKLPDIAVAVVHRADGSGTTYNFAYYLSAVSKEWADKAGADTAIQWPVGIGAKGNDGVASNVAGTLGAIGYVEYAYAKQNHMTTVAMVNKDGKTVYPTADTFAAAAVKAEWGKTKGFGLVLANQPGANAWPMTAVTFILVQKNPADGTATAEALKFFDWAYANGGAAAEALDYISLPKSVVEQIRKSWAEVKSAGKPVYAAK